MAPHEFVEIRLVCQANYLDPQLKTKLHEIRDNLRQILHTGRRRFALKKVQPWNSIKVTFDIPKEAADRLRLLAVQGNIRLIELGILSVEIVGQSNAIVVNNNKNPSITTTNSTDLTASSSLNSTPIHNPSIETKSDDHRSKRVKIENDLNQQNHLSTNNNVIQVPTTNVNHMNTSSHYLPQQVIRQHGQVHPTPTMNNDTTSNSYLHDNITLVNGNNLHDSWSGYKMKINGIHYYPPPQTQYEMKRCETNIPSQRSNTTPTTNSFESSSTTGLSS